MGVKLLTFMRNRGRSSVSAFKKIKIISTPIQKNTSPYQSTLMIWMRNEKRKTNLKKAY